MTGWSRARERPLESLAGRVGDMSPVRLSIVAKLQRRRAYRAVQKAVRDGRLAPALSCESCGIVSSALQGHHEDYYAPLDVRWLCGRCHSTANEARRRRVVDDYVMSQEPLVRR